MVATASPYWIFWITRDFPRKIAGLPKRKQLLLLIGGAKGTQKRDIKRALEMMKQLEDWVMAKTKNPLGLAPYDPADYLRTPKEVAMYLEAFFEDGVDHESLVMR
jgi:hypothetical protein